MTKRKKKRATIEEAYAYALAMLGSRPDVTGVDIGPKYVGKKRKKGQVIRVHVREKIAKKKLTRSELIPDEFLGIPSDVIAASYMRHSMPFFPSGRFDPVRPGVSVGNPKAKAGSIGLVVFDDASGAPCLLSAFHVLVGPSGFEGDPILQPSRFDGGAPGADTVGHVLTAPLPGLWGDAAVAKLNGARPFSREAFDTRVVIDEARIPQMGMRVTKTGRTTLTTRGRIEGLGTYFYPELPGGVNGFRVVPLTDDPSKADLCAPGDSGALYYVSGSTAGVGLHCAGGTDPAVGEIGIACHLVTALATLGVSLTPP
jgi:endonuclease G